ncbi:polysaccharide pyruvyl transferase family protein [Mesorhizobium abyssinicae]|uniref:polysaccharide pyruvyl transferase family protein n=1 Tax=Mesorhizobium TaxID=68287 RepID=UPI000FD318AE|nr:MULTISPECIES: polysaccharide pyruvyl transferase family protein [Mesorhizobium]RVC57071.1 dTDP-4-dehydrorhamnose 3,5-epimerase [Mesorhizobium sp. M4B.F.Ca.ET.088.02.2.1]MDX8434624.1 polysaccharide pyruvyl transferase family protein [Mesorhizobium abyssinicae]RWF34147.1 MAG: dTDP-4-dehydrorhamnose 3,5-epimerase [Mesorhizobium sp.]RWF42889.1 MAG: dTDP-4-dehydrorhamnose 3,5-epimerase [Mesorhizobium sp.]TIX19172.1 MAG: dTDP-4-dehydrorhamnose 3,5-epimerase [Mesorhizobium sp.]
MQSQNVQAETALDPHVQEFRRANGYDHTHVTRSTQRLRIALLGQFGVGNFGNDGSLEAMIGTLRRICPEAELTVICTRPETVGKVFGLKTIKMTQPGIQSRWLDRANRMLGRVPYKMWGLVRAFLELRGFHAVVVPGTGAFDDFSDTPFGMPYLFLKWLAMARLRGCVVAFASVGAGPAYHPLSRVFFAWAARCASYRSYRDGISRDFVRSLGVNVANDRTFPDLAFGLPIPTVEREISESTVVGVGVMNYRGCTGRSESIYSAYISKLAEFVARAVKRGFVVRLILGQDNDEGAVVDIIGRLRSRVSEADLARVAYSRSASLHDVMAQMQTTDVVVATRFHNVVCALRVGLPVISLGYLEKHDVLAADMGLSAFCANVETFSVEWLESRLDALLAEREARAQQVRESVPRYRRQLMNQEDLFRTRVFNGRYLGRARQIEAGEPSMDDEEIRESDTKVRISK